MGRGLSERRSCALIGISRSSFRYRHRPREEDEQLAKRLRKIARTRHKERYGYRRAWVELRRSGLVVNRKRVHRLWRLAGLALPPRHGKKRSKPTGSVPREATRPNEVWTYDFIQDACFGGRKLKMLTVVDEFTRESLGIEVATSLPSSRVLDVLGRLFDERGGPEYLRSDNGPEFIAKQVRAWLTEHGAETIYITPGHPWENAYEESFHGRFRDECLNVEVFASVAEARVVVEEWRRHYNEERPHSALAYRTPREFREAWEAANGNPRAQASPSVGLPHCGPPDEGGDDGQSERPCPRPYGRPARRSGRTPAEPYPPTGQDERYDRNEHHGNTEPEPALDDTRS
jgi:putative transposase